MCNQAKEFAEEHHKDGEYVEAVHGDGGIPHVANAKKECSTLSALPRAAIFIPTTRFAIFATVLSIFLVLLGTSMISSIGLLFGAPQKRKESHGQWNVEARRRKKSLQLLDSRSRNSLAQLFVAVKQ